ncbi:MAG: glycosyltransferase family 2 protein, partial [Ilumatobacter sp.]
MSEASGDVGGAAAMTVGWVVLTMGDRPAELAEAITSIRRMRPDVPVCVVVNGADHEPIVAAHPDVTVLESDVNLGVPGGRDLGVRSTTADLIFFLDDDARIIDEELMDRSIDRFVDESALAAISFHLVDEHGATARRHVPRLGRGDPDRSGPV